MKNLSDDMLIEKAKSGDESSLVFLLNKYKIMASKIARSYFLVGAEYDDLLQEAMIGLYKAYVSFDNSCGASFATFAHKCITRNVQSAVKMANRKKNQMLNNSVSLTSQGAIEVSPDDSDEDINLVIPSDALSPDEKLIESEKLAEIKEKIKSALSKLELNVLMLFLKGDSYCEIATKLNMNNKSVDNALSRVRHKLNFLKENK